MSWRYLVLYDGECGLCDRSVQWLLRHDRKQVLTFAPLQGETARPYVGASDALDTMILVEQPAGDSPPRTSRRSRAVLRILSKLGPGWWLLSLVRVIPAFLSDLLYRFVAAHRLRWFGRVDACRRPDEATRARFLP